MVFRRVMNRIDKIRDLLLPALEELEVRLYEIKWIANEKTLQVAVMKEDGSMDLDTCALVSEKLSEVLDEADPISEEYTLEVCSPGAEREIKDYDELDSMEGEYIYVRLSKPFKKMMEITGEVIGVEDGIVSLSYRDKAAVRTAKFPKEDIEFARMAVRI